VETGQLLRKLLLCFISSVTASISLCFILTSRLSDQVNVEDNANYHIFLYCFDAIVGSSRPFIFQLGFQEQQRNYHICFVRFPSSVVWCFGTWVSHKNLMLHDCLCISWNHISFSFHLSLSLSLSHTHTHTQDIEIHFNANFH